jgi:crotonobetainyl-CoA:carnitine CoA-transferase CaiB-like acyl-CoA transferase
MGDALAGLRVLDLTQGIAGPFGVKQLADHGADVIKIERPGVGDVSRRMGPFPDDVAHPERSGLFLYLNTNRRSVELDLANPAGAEKLRELVAGAHLLIESFRPATRERLGLHWEQLRALQPSLSMISVSNFGQAGPYRDWELTELTSFALTGPMYQTGLPGREPLGFAENATQTFAGLALANIALAMAIDAQRGGGGHYVDFSIAEGFLAGGERQPLSYFYSGEIPQRVEDALRAQYLVGAYPCKDGYIAVQGVGRGESWWPRVFRMMGQPELSDDPRFANGTAIAENKPAFDEIWLAWLATHTRKQVFDAAAEARFPIAPVYTAADIYRDEHFLARDVFVEIDHPEVGRLRYPGPPARLHAAPYRAPQPAPLLGQHSAQVLGQGAERAAPLAGSGATNPPAQPLAGLRILELAEGWAGPMTGMWLADLGAEVIKVEAMQRFDHARGPIEVPDGLSAYPKSEGGPRPYDVNSAYAQANRNKLGITIDLSRPQGVELFKELVKISEVVLTNMVTGVPEKMGIGYDDLRAVRPDLIMLTCSGYGASGPYARRVTMGGAMDGIAGYTWLRHYPDREPDTVNYSMHTDVVTGMCNAMAVLMAISQKLRTGAGQRVETSGVETCLHHIPHALMDYAINGHVQDARGNTHPDMAPHGVYPCAGEDRWIALTVATETQWRALCTAMGDPGWARDARFADARARIEQRGELDRQVAAWTRTRDHLELMGELQERHIPAAAVHDAAEHALDPHWQARGMYQPTELPGYGVYPLLASPWIVDGRRLGVYLPPPPLGAHNRQVLGGLLGLSDAELAELARQELIGDAPKPHAL